MATYCYACTAMIPDDPISREDHDAYHAGRRDSPEQRERDRLEELAWRKSIHEFPPEMLAALRYWTPCPQCGRKDVLGTTSGLCPDCYRAQETA